MRASAAVSLALVGSMSIFGIYSRQRANPNCPPGPEPVWVNGVMGVYDPTDGEFVPSTSPRFDAVCDEIQRRREQANGCAGGTYSPGTHWSYNRGYGTFSRPLGGAGEAEGEASHGFFSGISGAHGESDAHASSARGGFGGTGHGFGGGHS